MHRFRALPSSSSDLIMYEAPPPAKSRPQWRVNKPLNPNNQAPLGPRPPATPSPRCSAACLKNASNMVVSLELWLKQSSDFKCSRKVTGHERLNCVVPKLVSASYFQHACEAMCFCLSILDVHAGHEEEEPGDEAEARHH